ncbi:MAG: Nudix family hydrolase [Gammaproteobacteria bacterium]|nr:Nudix family hydrolase [Gammaproteobacteria bacterium]
MSRAHIAVGVIFNATRDQILLARRPDHASHSGLWEFPGGKLEAGESVQEALHRELEEELGLTVRSAAPLFRVDHDYPHIQVRLDVWAVTDWDGKVQGREGQKIGWVPIAELWHRDFPEANRAIVRWLCLPSVYVITPDLPAYDHAFFSRLDALISAGAKLFQFRNTRLSPEDRRHVLRDIAARCAARGVDLLVNGTADEALDARARGLHLNSARLMAMGERPLDRGYLIAASVHDTAEMEKVAHLDVDFAVLGPVAGTITHPGVAPLGWARFGSLARDAGRPVYALGGMRPADFERAKREGARGLAMIRGVWEAEDAAAAIRACQD